MAMGLDPAHLEATENSATTFQTAGAFPMLVLGPKGTRLLLNAGTHEARLWPGKSRQADSAEALKGCTIGKVEDHREEGSGFP